MRKYVLMAVAAAVAAVIAATRPEVVFGGEWCLIGLAWVAGQVLEDYQEDRRKKWSR